MVFSSLTFLCLFFPLTVGLHYLVKNGTARNALLLAASLLFYAWGEPVWILAMLFATAVNYVCARIIVNTKSDRGRKLALVVGIVISLAALLYFKYAAFLVNNFCGLAGLAYRMTQPKLPIGISFYTFQIITYTVDVYRGKAPLQKNPLWLLLYVSLFPQLIAGPIVRYIDVAAAIEDRKVTAQGMGEGFFRFSLGLGKKVLLANLCGEVLESLPIPAEMSFFSGWLAAALFLLQLYFDFSGYSEMAIGLGRMLGFRFLENFDAPLVSQSVSEFWRRWHISLGTFFREYVYIPLGGNRKGTWRTILNMLIVWSLTGLWHGASFNYLLWGLYFWVLLVLERYVLGDLLKRLPGFLRHGYLFLLVTLSFMVFYFEDLGQMGAYFAGLFRFSGPLLSADARSVLGSYWAWALLGRLCMGYLPRKAWARVAQKRPRLAEGGKIALLLVLFLLCVASLAGQSYNPFIYFRF